MCDCPRLRPALLGAALLLAASARLAGDQATLVATADNTLFETVDGSTSAGADDHFFAGRTDVNGGGALRRGVLRFAVAGAIPPGSTVTAASLALYLDRTQAANVTVSLHRLLADWGEAGSTSGGQGGQGGPSQPGDATWLHTFYPGSVWATPGGNFVSTSSAAATVGSSTGDYIWSSPQLAADVQGGSMAQWPTTAGSWSAWRASCRRPSASPRGRRATPRAGRASP